MRAGTAPSQEERRPSEMVNRPSRLGQSVAGGADQGFACVAEGEASDKGKKRLRARSFT